MTTTALKTQYSASIGRRSMRSCDQYSTAPSQMSTLQYDFGGKKQKILTALKQIDELNSGLVKTSIFFNLLSCMDVQLPSQPEQDIIKKFGLSHSGATFIKYNEALKLLVYDETQGEWIVKTKKKYQQLKRNAVNVRGSLESKTGQRQQHSNLQAENIKKAFGASSKDAEHVDDADLVSTVVNSRRGNQTVGASSIHTQSTTFSEMIKPRQLTQANVAMGRKGFLNEIGKYHPMHHSLKSSDEDQFFRRHQAEYPDYIYGQEPSKKDNFKSIDANSNVSSVDDHERKNLKQSQIFRTHMLRKLLQTKDDKEKDRLQRLISCIRFMHKHYDIDYKCLNHLRLTLIKDYHQSSGQVATHIPVSIFLKAASLTLKIDNFQETKLFEKVRECLVDDSAHSKEDQFTMNNLSLLVDLYQYLPYRKTKNRNRSQQMQGALNNSFNYVEKMKKDLEASKQDATSPVPTNRKNMFRTVGMPSPQPQAAVNKELLQHNLTVLAKRLNEKFSQVANVFRHFDCRSNAAVSYTDFSYILDDLSFGFSRDEILQIFTYLDRDKDGHLRYADFYNLCQEGSDVLQADKVFESSLKQTKEQPQVIDPFIKIIRDVKAKQKSRERCSTQGDPMSRVKTIRQAAPGNSFVSTEVKQYLEKNKTAAYGVGIHSPSHNDLESHRTTISSSVWGNVSNLTQNQNGTIDLSKYDRTHGSTSNAINMRNGFNAKLGGGGTISGCMQYDYEKDFVVEAKMRDSRHQELRESRLNFDLRKSTKTQEKRVENTKRKLKIIDEKEKAENVFSPIHKHPPGKVPQYYPMQTINKVINGINSAENSHMDTTRTTMQAATQNQELLQNAFHKVVDGPRNSSMAQIDVRNHLIRATRQRRKTAVNLGNIHSTSQLDVHERRSGLDDEVSQNRLKLMTIQQNDRRREGGDFSSRRSNAVPGGSMHTLSNLRVSLGQKQFLDRAAARD